MRSYKKKETSIILQIWFCLVMFFVVMLGCNGECKAQMFYYSTPVVQYQTGFTYAAPVARRTVSRSVTRSVPTVVNVSPEYSVVSSEPVVVSQPVVREEVVSYPTTVASPPPTVTRTTTVNRRGLFRGVVPVSVPTVRVPTAGCVDQFGNPVPCRVSW